MRSWQCASAIFCTVSLTASWAAAEPLPRGAGWFRGQPVQFRIWNGQAVAEGDMLLGPAEDVLDPAAGNPAAGKGRDAIAIASESFRWPNGVIPYEIDPALPNRNRVTAAIADWESRTPVRFRLREGEVDFVRINRVDSGCNANVGRIGGRQSVNLGPECGINATIHELGHTIGLFHTMSRIDRNRNLTVLYENIDKDAADQFDQELVFGIDVGPYDYGSIMHYQSGAATRNFGLAMLSIPAGIPIGLSNTISESDAHAVRRLYGDPPREVTLVTHPPGGQLIVDGQIVRTPFTAPWVAGERHAVTAASVLSSASATTQFRFAKWSDGRERSRELTVDGNTTLYIAHYAQFTELRTASIGNGRVQVSPSSPDGYYALGTPVTITAIPDEGFRFLQWSSGPGGSTFLSSNGSGAGLNPTRLIVRQDAPFYVARFTDAPVTTITSEPGGVPVMVNGVTVLTPANFVFAPGSAQSVSVPEFQTPFGPSRRYLFRGWSNGGERLHRFEAPAESATLTAQLTEQFQVIPFALGIRLASAPGITVARSLRLTPDIPDRYYDAGWELTVDAVGSEQVAFSNWLGDLAGAQSPRTIVIRDQTAVGAHMASPLLFTQNALVNHASQQPSPLVPGALMTLFVPAVPADAALSIGDLPAEVISARDGAITFLVPAALPPGNRATLTLRIPGRAPFGQPVGVAPAQPGVYATPSEAVRGGELRLRVTGIGRLDEQNMPAEPLRVELGGVPVPVTAIAPGEQPGQFVLTLLPGEEVPAGEAIPVIVSSGGARSQLGLTITVR